MRKELGRRFEPSPDASVAGEALSHPACGARPSRAHHELGMQNEEATRSGVTVAGGTPALHG